MVRSDIAALFVDGLDGWKAYAAFASSVPPPGNSEPTAVKRKIAAITGGAGADFSDIPKKGLTLFLDVTTGFDAIAARLKMLSQAGYSYPRIAAHLNDNLPGGTFNFTITDDNLTKFIKKWTTKENSIPVLIAPALVALLAQYPELEFGTWRSEDARVPWHIDRAALHRPVLISTRKRSRTLPAPRMQA